MVYIYSVTRRIVDLVGRMRVLALTIWIILLVDHLFIASNEPLELIILEFDVFTFPDIVILLFVYGI